MTKERNRELKRLAKRWQKCDVKITPHHPKFWPSAIVMTLVLQSQIDENRA